ncbi:MAG: DsbA family protein [Thaumarchaeota archaeon]|nr:DsbA family protein [Nitrososphaerota archaeon]MCL5316893.1 DsbA family protein [Nitrososphaerota archaeon]
MESFTSENKFIVVLSVLYIMENQPSSGLLAHPKMFGAAMLTIGLLGGILIGIYLPSLLSAQPSTGNQPPQRQNIPIGNAPSLGDLNAPVTIVEFSDFQCPFCASFFNETLPQIQKDYIDTGRIRLVYKNFPITKIHPYAEKAAEAAECAKEQGKFWEYHDLLFGNQQAWISENATTTFEKYASTLKLNITQFSSCLNTNKYSGEISKDLQDGQKAQVSGTPTFFINGIRVVGAQPYSVFKDTIDSELKRQ